MFDLSSFEFQSIPKAYRFSHVAYRLGIAKSTLHREIKEGRLGAFKINNRWYITEKAVVQWMKTNFKEWPKETA